MSKHKRLCSIILAITVLLSALVIQGLNVFAEIEDGIITGENVRLRSEPSSESAAILKLNYNEKVTILEKVEGNEAEEGHGTTWYKIKRDDGTEGFAYGFYVFIMPKPSDANFENFPESYREALKKLQAIYPKSTFIPDNLNITFEEAVSIQFTTAQRKQVTASNGISWYSMHQGAYNWQNGTYINNNGGWISASKSIIAYYLDPRNFLTHDTAFMFVQQSYNPTQTAEMVKIAVEGTFLELGYGEDPNAYINNIMSAAQSSGVSPLVLAATILVEQGPSGKSSLISGTYPGYEGYYNFFNIGASGTTETAVITSGLKQAKDYGWDTREKSILGGAQTYADGYINEGQDTFYYKNFNFVNKYPTHIWHQYAQSIFDAYNNALRLKEGYSEIGNENITLTFRIPVFKDMPDTPVVKPVEDNKQNNFYLTQMNVVNLSPTFDMFVQNYSLTVSEDTTVLIKLPEKAEIISQDAYQLVAGTNQCILTIKAETGYTNDYIIQVEAAQPCVLKVAIEQPTTPEPKPEPEPNPEPEPEPEPEPKPEPEPEPEPPVVKKGDPNGDGTINGIDLAAVRLHILGLRTFTDNELLAADVNGDSKVDGIDLAAVRLHILGLRTIE